MKYSLISFIFFAVLVSCNVSTDSENNMDLSSTDTIVEYEENQEKLSAVEFNNELTNIQNGMLNQVDNLFQSDSSDVDINLENAIFEANLNLDKLNSYENQENADGFLSAMVDLLEFYKEELSHNFSAVRDILKKGELFEDDKMFLDNYDRKFASNEEELFKVVFERQEEFAADNNIKLETL